MEKRGTKPKYREIAEALRDQIAGGKYAAGAQLPTKSQLMAEYSVALNTVDRALEILRAEGWAESTQGVGTFARVPDQPVPAPESDRFADLETRVRQQEARLARLEAQMEDVTANIGIPLDHVTHPSSAAG
ncbi:GntR family transcriptional regulator [Nocardia takedensis]|uniref:GntR family transcriptional regulator n=1 Tax=Nocardia takedensis TaxID=259390 RepID=UPI003F7649CC